jgi:hypothetical protein
LPAPARSPCWRSRPAEPAAFHHLHLAASGAGQVADFYARLFTPASIARGRFWSLEGIQGRGAWLLVSEQRGPWDRRQSPMWHFGWGTVSLGETYRQHVRTEVNWRPPYAGLERDFHVHLRSRQPAAAAEWFRVQLGGDVREDRPPSNAGNPSEGRVRAIVTFPHVRLVIHEWSDEGGESGAWRTDHLAFIVRDAERVTAAVAAPLPVAAPALRPGTLVTDHPYRLDGLPSRFLAGPDGLPIELVAAPPGPAFWRDR